MEHNHPDIGTLTFGCPACVAAARPHRVRRLGPPLGADGLTPAQRRAKRAQQMINAGRHPANGERLLEVAEDATRPTCADCAHLHRSGHAAKVYVKCPHHRLGISHSAASDVRTGWPACALFEPKQP